MPGSRPRRSCNDEGFQVQTQPGPAGLAPFRLDRPAANVMNETISVRSARSASYWRPIGWFLKTKETTSVSTTTLLMRPGRLSCGPAIHGGPPGNPRCARLRARNCRVELARQLWGPFLAGQISSSSVGLASKSWSGSLRLSTGRLPHLHYIPQSGLLTGDPGVDAAAEDIERQRARSQHLVMEGPDVEFFL